MSFLLKASVNEFGFELGDAVLGEPQVGAATFETLSQFAVFLGQLADPSLQCLTRCWCGVGPGTRHGDQVPLSLSISRKSLVCPSRRARMS